MADGADRAATATVNDANALASVSVVIPCLNEEDAIGDVVANICAHGVGEVIVVDGASKDKTAERARAAGARVVVEPCKGYGQAMLSGLAALSPTTGIVLFIDGDGSDDTAQIPALLAPILAGRADFVLGSRLRGKREPGSLSPPQIAAGLVAGAGLWLLYGAHATDMSPFRAITWDALDKLGMRETSFGWNLEMQMRVAAAKLRSVELPVGQRHRQGGVSKVSGNALVAIHVAWVLARTFVRLAVTLRRERLTINTQRPAL